MGSPAAYVDHRNVYQLVRFQGGRDAQSDIVAVVDRIVVTTIAKIRAWEPALQDDLLAEEGGVTGGLGDVDDCIECRQHFVHVAGHNAPNGEGVPPLREDDKVCLLYFKAVGAVPKAQQRQLWQQRQ